MFRLSGFSNILTALRIRNYRVYMVGSIFSLTGFWMQRIAIGWLTWELTGSSFCRASSSGPWPALPSIAGSPSM